MPGTGGIGGTRRGWQPNPALAYGWSEDFTRDQRSAEQCRLSNARSMRHAHLTADERKQDDYDVALQRVLEQREIDRQIERSRYVRHYTQ